MYSIVNPNSRSGHGLHLWQEAENILKEKKISMKYFLQNIQGTPWLYPDRLQDLDFPVLLVFWVVTEP